MPGPENFIDYINLSFRPPPDAMMTIQDIVHGLKSVLGLGDDEDLDTQNIYACAVGGAYGSSQLEQVLRAAHIKINSGEGPVPVMILIHFGIHYYGLEVNADGTKLVDLRDTPVAPRTVNFNQQDLFLAVQNAIGIVNAEVQAAVDAEAAADEMHAEVAADEMHAEVAADEMHAEIAADEVHAAVVHLTPPDRIHFRDTAGFQDTITMSPWDGTSCGYQQLSFILQRRNVDNPITQATTAIQLRREVENLFFPAGADPISYPRFHRRYRERDLPLIFRFEADFDDSTYDKVHEALRQGKSVDEILDSLGPAPVDELRAYKKRVRAVREEALSSGVDLSDIYDFTGSHPGGALHPGVRDAISEYIHMDRAGVGSGNSEPCVLDDDDPDRALAIALQEEELESIRRGGKLKLKDVDLSRRIDRLRAERRRLTTERIEKLVFAESRAIAGASGASAEFDPVRVYYDDDELDSANSAVLSGLRTYIASNNTGAMTSDGGDIGMAYAAYYQELELAKSVDAEAREEAKSKLKAK